MLKVGDIVTRKSYGGDIYFKVKNIDWFGNIDIVGVDYRIEADAPMNDLIPVDEFTIYRNRKTAMEQIDEKINEINKNKETEQKKSYEPSEHMIKKTKVLHIDGDKDYLKICLKYYELLGLEAIGEQVKEQEQPKMIIELIKKYTPDIVVITGHDALSKGAEDLNEIASYRSSKYFVETVKKAREYEPDMDKLIIFAGACQSHYEALIEAGANYASAPERVLIHAVDPVLISERIANTPIDRILKVDEALMFTFTGKQGLGGFETRGKGRKGSPKGKYKS
ncbi:sporulation peptidase YabG [Vallitalea okinawensis]|uniref:sporulation peptidase YabG n=1 Tax=Vallitalea okinawensis TaxID=2078660 RepID=UPI000CFC5B54|nr:sporulation peptidase YabG [Vallitalea okinawensis]